MLKFYQCVRCGWGVELPDLRRHYGKNYCVECYELVKDEDSEKPLTASEITADIMGLIDFVCREPSFEGSLAIGFLKTDDLMKQTIIESFSNKQLATYAQIFNLSKKED